MTENKDKNTLLNTIKLHPNELQVEIKGKKIQLRKKEYQLLEFLVNNKNKVINRNTLLEYVWNYNVQAMTNTLEVHISKLRRKINSEYSSTILQTVYGLGYKFCDGPCTSQNGQQELPFSYQ